MPTKPTLTLATRNSGKLAELRATLGKLYNVQGPNKAGLLAPLDEPFDTFSANAEAKASAVQRVVGGLVLADDSGLSVDALHGAPGVWSARYAGPGATDSGNNEKLLHAMKGIPMVSRTAHFTAVLCLASDGDVHFFEGTCAGRIAEHPAGAGGFGYDPVFIPDGYDCTMAELTAETKARISHRGDALRTLIHFLQRLPQHPNEK